MIPVIVRPSKWFRASGCEASTCVLDGTGDGSLVVVFQGAIDWFTESLKPGYILVHFPFVH